MVCGQAAAAARRWPPPVKWMKYFSFVDHINNQEPARPWARSQHFFTFLLLIIRNNSRQSAENNSQYKSWHWKSGPECIPDHFKIFAFCSRWLKRKEERKNDSFLRSSRTYNVHRTPCGWWRQWSLWRNSRRLLNWNHFYFAHILLTQNPQPSAWLLYQYLQSCGAHSFSQTNDGSEDWFLNSSNI